MMKLILVYGLVVVLGVFNGMFSPHSFLVFALQGIWYPSIWPAPLNLMFILSGVISALLHVLCTGVPASILEKLFKLPRLSTGIIWLAVMLLPTAQTVVHMN